MKSLFMSFACTSGLLIYFPPYWFLGKPHMHALRTPEKTEDVAYAPVLRSFCQGVQALLPGWGAESDTADDSQLTMSSGVTPRGRKSLHLRLSLTGGSTAMQCILYIWALYYNTDSSGGPSLFLCCQSVRGGPQWHLHGGSAASPLPMPRPLPHPH